MLIACLSVVALALMVGFQVTHVRRVKAQRRLSLNSAMTLLADPVLTQDGIGFPTVAGRYRGRPARVELLPDTLAMRELPTLYLVVSVRWRLPLEMPVDLLLRPRSSDIVSPGERYTCEWPIPAQWPQHMRVATPRRGTLPDLERVATLATRLADQRTKSMLIGPGGVRLVAELTRGDISRYRVVRRAAFTFELPAADLTIALDAVHAIAREIEALAEPVSEAA